MDAAAMLRSEQRERLHCAVEALAKRLAPSLAGLDPDALAAVLSVELVRVAEAVQGEHLGRLADLARPSR